MKEKVAEILSVLFGKDIAVDSGFNRDDNVEWDSMKHIEIVVSLEEEFGVSIPPAIIGKLVSIDSICAEISKLTVA